MWRERKGGRGGEKEGRREGIGGRPWLGTPALQSRASELEAAHLGTLRDTV